MLKQDRIKQIPYHTAFVVNPAAGDGKAGLIWSGVEAVLKQEGQPYLAYFTRRAGDGSRLAARAVFEGAELVVAVGGDGTLREVLNGLNLDKNVLGVIPAGTGNGFVRSLDLPLHWKNALRGLFKWAPRRIDIGQAHDSLFLNSAGIGLDGAVAEAAARKYKRLKGYLAYAAALIDQAVTFSRFHCRVECNGLHFEEDQALVALVANGRYYGGKLNIAPQASIDDGFFDLCLIRKRSIPELLALGARVAVRRHLSSKAFIKMRGRTFTLETSRSLPLQIDGEVTKATCVKVEIIPSALRVLAPASSKLLPAFTTDPRGRVKFCHDN